MTDTRQYVEWQRLRPWPRCCHRQFPTSSRARLVERRLLLEPVLQRGAIAVMVTVLLPGADPPVRAKLRTAQRLPYGQASAGFSLRERSISANAGSSSKDLMRATWKMISA